MAKKNKKQGVVMQKVTFDTSHIESLDSDKKGESQTVEKVETPKVEKPEEQKTTRPARTRSTRRTSPKEPKDTGFQILRMLLPVTEIARFSDICIRFQGEVKNFAFSKQSDYFEAFIDFVANKYQTSKLYSEAPDDFIKYIQRKGVRPNMPDLGPKEVFYLRPSNSRYKKYLDILYSFLQKYGDVMDPLYSTTYFFKDFLNIVEKDLDKIIKLHKS